MNFSQTTGPVMSFQEIADALGVERKTVLSDYSRAIAKLKRNEVLSKLMFVASLQEHMRDGRQPIYPEW